MVFALRNILFLKLLRKVSATTSDSAQPLLRPPRLKVLHIRPRKRLISDLKLSPKKKRRTKVCRKFFHLWSCVILHYIICFILLFKCTPHITSSLCEWIIGKRHPLKNKLFILSLFHQFWVFSRMSLRRTIWWTTRWASASIACGRITSSPSSIRPRIWSSSTLPEELVRKRLERETIFHEE